MRIAVFGLGYVGSVTAVCLTENGHDVIGVDQNPTKVEWMSNAIPPINEPGFAERLRRALRDGRFRATTDAQAATAGSDLGLVCVGTPTAANGETFLGAVEDVVRAVNDALLASPHAYTLAVRSTIPPGAMEERVLPILYSGAARELGSSLRVCFNPEFLREGSAINDFSNPPYTIVGMAEIEPAADLLVRSIESAYCLTTAAPTIRLRFKEAELLKVICNAFHALKIAFANEVGTLASRVGADPIAVMDAFVQDTKLNISAAYLRPGFAFGGSCLPKDIRGLLHLMDTAGLRLPLCKSILPSNDEHLQRGLAAIMAHDGSTVGLAGIVFKPRTDDVRESPALWLARRILNGGRKLLVYEPEIDIARLVGANLAFMEKHLPEYRHCLVSWEKFAAEADTIAVVRPGLIPSAAREKLHQPVISLYEVELL